MIINFKARLAFIAQTKCGSTSIENALRWHANIAFTGHHKVTHITTFNYRRFVQPYLNFIDEKGVETSCLFRNPTDWLASWWKYHSREAVAGTAMDTSHMSFEEYVIEFLEGSDKPCFNVGRQSDMLTGPVRPIAIDHLYRYEDMDQFIALWEERLKRSLNIERHNVSPDRSGPDLSAATRGRLEQALADQFEIWESKTVGHGPIA